MPEELIDQEEKEPESTEDEAVDENVDADSSEKDSADEDDPLAELRDMTPEEQRSWARVANDAKKANCSADRLYESAAQFEHRRAEEEKKMFNDKESDSTPDSDSDSGDLVTVAQLKAFEKNIEDRAERKSNASIDRMHIEELGLSSAKATGIVAAIDRYSETTPNMTRDQLWQATVDEFGLKAKGDTDEKLSRAARGSRTVSAGRGGGTAPAPTPKGPAHRMLSDEHLEAQKKQYA